MCTAIRYDQPMSRGLGTTQRGIIAELMKLPIESWPRGIPVVVLAERLGCSDRQVRTAVYSLQRRGLVALQKEARPGRQGQSLIVWDAMFHRSWQTFITEGCARAGAGAGQEWERQRREWLVQRGLL